MKQETKQQISSSIADFRLPRYHEIPNVGLYLEQATKYVCEYLEPLGEYTLTPSMISNYVKKGLIANPIKKQYSRDHIAYLFFIAMAKRSAKVNSLFSILSPYRFIFYSKTHSVHHIDLQLSITHIVKLCNSFSS